MRDQGSGMRDFSALPLFLLVLFLELRDDVGIGQCGRVADRLAFRDVAEQPAHDLSGPRLGQIGGKQDLIRPRDCADLAHDVLLELVGQRDRRLHAFLQGDERGDGLSLDVVRTADDGRLGHLRVIDERAFDSIVPRR